VEEITPKQRGINTQYLVILSEKFRKSHTKKRNAVNIKQINGKNIIIIAVKFIFISFKGQLAGQLTSK
jgi:hypothetical protein